MTITNIVSELIPNEPILLKLAGGWGICGPHFFAWDGTFICTVEHFANGDLRYCTRHAKDCAVMRDGELCSIAHDSTPLGSVISHTTTREQVARIGTIIAV